MIQEKILELTIPQKYTSKAQMAAAISKQFSVMLKNEKLQSMLADRYAPAVIERRKKAILNFVAKMDKQYKATFPDIEVPAATIDLLTVVSSPIDEAYYRGRLDTAAALWMLNQISDNQKMQQLKAVLPKDPKELYDIPTVHIHDCAFSEELIRSMTYVVLNRNPEYGIAMSVNMNQNLKRFPSPVHDHMTCREIFNYALSLIDQSSLQRAIDNCKQKLMDVFKAYLQGYDVYRKQVNAQIDVLDKVTKGGLVMYDTQFDPEVAEAIKKCEDLLVEMQAYRLSFVDRHAFMKLLKTAEKSIFSVEVDDPLETAFAVLYLFESDDDLAWVYNLAKPLLLAAEQQMPWSNGYEHVFDIDGNNFDDAEKESLFFPECDIDRDVWDDNEEEADIERCDDDLLLCDRYGEELTPDIYYEDDEDVDRAIDSDYKDVHLLSWATRKTISVNGADTTLSKLLYSVCHTVLPTTVTCTLLDKVDLPDEEKMYLLALLTASSQCGYSLSLAPPKGVTHKVGEDTESAESAVTPEQEEPSSEEIDALDAVYVNLKEMEDLRTKNKSLKAELEKLKTSLYYTEKELRKTTEKLETKAEETEKIRREVTDLRNLLYLQKGLSKSQEQQMPAAQDTDDDSDVIYVSFPFETDKKIVVFGGHDSWLREIRPLLPTVRFVDRESSTYDVDIIRNADVLWFQHNALAHSQFGKAKDIARQYDVDIRYFRYVSARKCAEELVEDILLRD